MNKKKNVNQINLFVGGATPFADNRGNSAIIGGLFEFLSQLDGYSFKINVWHTYPESLQRHLKGIQTTSSLNSIDRANMCINIVYHKLPSKPFLAYVVYSERLVLSIAYITVTRIIGLLGVKIASLQIEVVRELNSSDCIIELNFGDTFTDSYYGKIIWFLNILRMTMEFMSKKPLYIFPQSIGPFKSIFSKALARVFLRKAKIIAIRESYSLKCVTDLGIDKKKVHFAPDLSFWLRLISDTEAIKILNSMNFYDSKKRNRKLVGILLSEKFLSARKSALSIRTIAQTVDHLIDKLEIDVIFIPHGTSVTFSLDSRALSLNIHRLLKNRNHAVVLSKEYSVEELWGIIGQCDFIISALTHPVISSLRQGIPVIALTYSHKTLGLMHLFKMDKYLLTYDEFNDQKIISLAEDLLKNSEEIKKTLKSNRNFILEKMNEFKTLVECNLYEQNFDE